MAKKPNSAIAYVLIGIVSAAAAIAIYHYATRPDPNSTEAKVNAAMKEVQKTFDKAAKELEDSRPADHIKEDSKKFMEELNKAIEPPKK